MKKLAILIVLAMLSACSDSPKGEAPSEVAPSVADDGVSTTPKDSRLAAASSETSPKERWDELRPAYIAARDEYREIRAQLSAKEEELKAATAGNSADVTRLSAEVEQLKLAFVAAQNRFVPINKEMQALRQELESQRTEN